MNQRTAFLSGAVIAVAIILASGTSFADDQSILLKPKFETGQRNYLERIISMTQKMGQMSTPINSVFGVIEEVENAAQDETSFRLTIDRRAFSVGGAAPASFDSDSPDAGQSKELAAIFRPMIGMKMTMVVDKNLKAKSFKGPKAIVKKVDESAAGNSMWANMRDDITSAQYKATWGSSRLVLFPNREVEVGDTWKGSFTVTDSTFGEMKNAYECKLEGITEKDGAKEATVSYKVVTTKVGDPKKQKQAEGPKFAFKSSEAEGTAVFESARGCFVRINEKGTTIISAEMMGRQMELTISGEEKLTVLSVEKREQQKAKRQESSGKSTEPKEEKKLPSP